MSQRAEEARRMKRQAEDRLALVESEKEAVQKSAQEEIERVKRSVANEVAKAEAAMRARHQEKLGRLKQYCEDMEEVNWISSLVNQSGGIKTYLEELNQVGTPISMLRLKSLEEDKEKYIAELGRLDVIDITDADFQVTPPRDAESSDRAVVVVAAGTDPPIQPVAELSSGSESDDEDEEAEGKRGEKGGEAKDPSTGVDLMPLDGNPVIPDA